MRDVMHYPSGMTGRLRARNTRKKRNTAIAAGIAILSTAAAAGGIIGAQPAGAAAAAPAAAAARTAPAATGPLIELQVGNNLAGAVCEGWHTASLNEVTHTVWGWFTTARAVASGRTVGTCIGQVREYVRYPNSEYLTWSAHVYGDNGWHTYQRAIRPYGARGSIHYWTWTVNRYVPNNTCGWDIRITAGNHSANQNEMACLM